MLSALFCLASLAPTDAPPPAPKAEAPAVSCVSGQCAASAGVVREWHVVRAGRCGVGQRQLRVRERHRFGRRCG